MDNSGVILVKEIAGLADFAPGNVGIMDKQKQLAVRIRFGGGDAVV